ncbi:aminoacyl-tRNA deacylase [Jeotgalibacillus sp. R-1-5s-1]|uniref:aminoacyl-tRNA deacylase n=1 Tax=Jeotgalibacillus sp. R-1-5s-1 TaxID=2555897 RepID=UPI00106D0AC7|nr:YbaK/EbsC family protein [Jeotgalibacillus sp. R-1-5s-1]TFE00168.1 hypothetical protein E2491_06960 [Jeotgalibacillus sp. R-1-5s-1]
MSALLAFIKENQSSAELLQLKESTHSVEEAAQAVQASTEQLVKNICMISEDDELIVAIVKGEDRASTSRVSKALNIPRPRLANEHEIIDKSGFPAGGVPSFGFEATFLIDPKVMETPVVYTGGGTAQSLIKIPSEELLRLSGGQVVRVRR